MKHSLNPFEPNHLGEEHLNSGVEYLGANYGLGLGALSDANAVEDAGAKSATNRVRNAKAREFGMPAHKIGKG